MKTFLILLLGIALLSSCSIQSKAPKLKNEYYQGVYLPGNSTNNHYTHQKKFRWEW